MLAVRLPESLEMRLNALSLKTHRSKSFYIKKAEYACLVCGIFFLKIEVGHAFSPSHLCIASLRFHSRRDRSLEPCRAWHVRSASGRDGCR